jgi:hypothetical protein
VGAVPISRVQAAPLPDAPLNLPNYETNRHQRLSW